MKIRRFLLAASLLSVCATAVAVPPPADAQAESDVAALTAEVESLKTKTSSWGKVLDRLPKISGYIQTGYEWSDGASTFFIKRARIALSDDIANKLDYRLQLEFAGSPKIVDAYVNYKPFAGLQIKIGQYKVPFSIESMEYAAPRSELIEHPMAVRYLTGLNDVCGLSASGRDLGAMLHGGFFERDGYHLLNYDLGVFNGEGINNRDRNKSKDIAARIVLKPLPGLLVSGYYYRGEYGEQYLERERYGFGACYDRGAVVVRGEWIGGTTGIADGEEETFDSDGWYAVAGWRASKKWMVVGRCEQFAKNTRIRSETSQTNYTAGVQWQPVKALRCQLNYTYEQQYQAEDRNVVSCLLTALF